MSLQLPFEPWLGVALRLYWEVDHFSTSWGRRPNKQSKRGCPFFLLLLLPQGERDSTRCNHSSEDKSILLPPPFMGRPGAPQLVWLLCPLPRVEPHLHVSPYMDGWQVFGLGFNSLCTTLYGWMTSFLVGLIVCKWGNMALSILLAYSHFLFTLVLLGKLTITKVTPMAWNPTRHED